MMHLPILMKQSLSPDNAKAYDSRNGENQDSLRMLLQTILKLFA